MLTKLRNSFKLDFEPNIRFNIYNGIALAISTNLVNPYFAKFAERLGANAYAIASLNSLPAFISLFALIPGALFIDALGNKIKSTATLMLVHKLFFLMMAALPLFDIPNKAWLFVILVAIMNLPGSIYTMGYQSSIGDLFSPRNRGIAMSLRNKYADLFRLFVTFLSGFLLTFPKSNHTIIALYQVFFVLSFVFGLWEVYTYKKFDTSSCDSYNLSSKARNKSSVLKDTFSSLKFAMSHTLTHVPYRSFLISSVLFYFGWQMGWPLFNLYTIQYLGANEAWLSAISIASGVASITTATLWAKFADRFGYPLAAFIATFGMSITPFLYVLSKSLSMLVLFNLLIGFSITGTTLVLFNLLLETTPNENRTTVIAFYNTIIAISATVTPLIGVWIMDQSSIQTALCITGGFRFLGCFSFLVTSIRIVRNKNKTL
ncbi:MAG: hypothetical protein BGO41_05510 [Clostridiales bacterium 38-18]|nr:MAG: hypothetical protein BGO41_05510 [Clostridiales bacterium 38-18]